MKQLWDKKELIKLIQEQGGGAVSSVNGKTGDVVLDGTDIKLQNTKSVQENFERVDESIEDEIDTRKDEDDGIKARLDVDEANITNHEGRIGTLETNLNNLDGKALKIPLSQSERTLVATNTAHEQEQIGIGDGLEVVNGKLNATGGGGGATIYVHRIQITITRNYVGYKSVFALYSSSSTPISDYNGLVSALAKIGGIATKVVPFDQAVIFGLSVINNQFYSTEWDSVNKTFVNTFIDSTQVSAITDDVAQI